MHDVAECARLLEINLAHYQLKYGTLPLDKVLDAVYAEEANDEQIKLVNRGMETLSEGLCGIV